MCIVQCIEHLNDHYTSILLSLSKRRQIEWFIIVFLKGVLNLCCNKNSLWFKNIYYNYFALLEAGFVWIIDCTRSMVFYIIIIFWLKWSNTQHFILVFANLKLFASEANFSQYRHIKYIHKRLTLTRRANGDRL